jgi:biopolymer transport protein ExbD
MTRRDRLGLDTPEDVPIDMSPMIDLVFLLLIFFMTSSTLITFLKDRRVDLPVAIEARIPQRVIPRLVVNVYQDGSIGDEKGNSLDEYSLPQYLRKGTEGRTDVRLQIRSDRRVAHAAVKSVLRSARSNGIERVIFSSYKAEL